MVSPVSPRPRHRLLAGRLDEEGRGRSRKGAEEVEQGEVETEVPDPRPRPIRGREATKDKKLKMKKEKKEKTAKKEKTDMACPPPAEVGQRAVRSMAAWRRGVAWLIAIAASTAGPIPGSTATAPPEPMFHVSMFMFMFQDRQHRLLDGTEWTW